MRSLVVCGWMLITFVGITNAQNPRFLDLRKLLVPIPEEEAAAARIPISSVSDGKRVAFPVEIFIESISPVSQTNANMTVNLVFRNTGDRDLRLPISLERKVLHYEGNTYRRQLGCFRRIRCEADRPKISRG